MGTVVVTTEISRKGLLDIFWSMYLKELGLPLEAKLKVDEAHPCPGIWVKGTEDLRVATSKEHEVVSAVLVLDSLEDITYTYTHPPKTAG